MSEPQEYQVTARKWRPSEFSSVVGQEHVTQTIRNAIRQERLHHAYLFSGPRGVGKTTTARILARVLNCQNPGEELEPCGQCDSCREIAAGRSLDVVEIDGASNNSVEDIRKLRDNAKYPPVSGRYKLYVIDEVHMLSTSAFNALLKTLEEPPRHLVFVFATTEPHKVPATILSRCQRFDFRRMQIPDIVGRLRHIAEAEGYTVDDDALTIIARKGDGSMRDSQSIFDQVISFCGTSVTLAQATEALNLIDQEFFFRATDMIRNHDPAEAFRIVEEVVGSGFDIQEYLTGLAEHLRNFLTVATLGSPRLIETARVYVDRYAAEAPSFTQGDLARALHVVLAAQQAIRTASQPRLRLELSLVQLATMDSTIELSRLLERIDKVGDAPATQLAPQNGSASERPASSTGPAPAAGSTPSTPPPSSGGGIASMVREQVESAPGKGARNVDLSSFPTTPPPSAHLRGSSPSGGDVPRMIADAPPPVNGGSYGQTNGSAGGAVVAEAPSVTIGEVQRGWTTLIEACSERPSLMAMLRDVRPAEIRGETLRLYVHAEPAGALLQRNRQYFIDRTEQTFGRPLQPEIVVGQPPGEESRHVNGRSGTPAAAPHDNHPFIVALVEQLGASRI